MSFMQPEVYEGDYYLVETDNGTCIVPADDAGNPQTNADLADYCEGDVHDPDDPPTKHHGWLGRYQAPGYTDATDWVVGATEQQVREELNDLYGDDDEEVLNDGDAGAVDGDDNEDRNVGLGDEPMYDDAGKPLSDWEPEPEPTRPPSTWPTAPSANESAVADKARNDKMNNPAATSYDPTLNGRPMTDDEERVYRDHWLRIAQVKTNYSDAADELAKDIFDEYVRTEGEPPARGDTQDFDYSGEVHQACDDYVSRLNEAEMDELLDDARRNGCHRDAVEEGILEVTSADDCEKMKGASAYLSLECMVQAELDRLLDDWWDNHEEEDEEEEDDADTDPGVGGVALPTRDELQRAYDQGQQSPAGSSTPPMRPGEMEAFRMGNYDRWGGGFGPAPNRRRTVQDVKPDGMPILAWMRQVTASAMWTRLGYRTLTSI